MTEPSLPELEAERDRLYAQLGGRRRFPARVGQRELPQVREAELRVRAAGPSWSRAEVLVDPDRPGRRTVGRQLAAAEVEKVRLRSPGMRSSRRSASGSRR